jgi:hypothetical protein
MVAACPSEVSGLIILAAAYVRGSHDKEAKEAVGPLLNLSPNATVQHLQPDAGDDDPTFKANTERIMEGLRTVGLPEEQMKAN